MVVIWWYDGAVSLGKQLTDHRGWAWSEGFIDLLPQGGGASSGWGCRVSPSREMIHTETGQEPGTHTVGGCQSPAHRTVSPMELYACIVANPAQVLPWCNGVMLLFGGWVVYPAACDTEACYYRILLELSSAARAEKRDFFFSLKKKNLSKIFRDGRGAGWEPLHVLGRGIRLGEWSHLTPESSIQIYEESQSSKKPQGNRQVQRGGDWLSSS